MVVGVSVKPRRRARRDGSRDARAGARRGGAPGSAGRAALATGPRGALAEFVAERVVLGARRSTWSSRARFMNVETLWDDANIWSLKALGLYHLEGLVDGLARNPQLSGVHLDYPILQPLVEASFFHAIGAVDLRLWHAELWLLLGLVDLDARLAPRAARAALAVDGRPRDARLSGISARTSRSATRTCSWPAWSAARRSRSGSGSIAAGSRTRYSGRLPRRRREREERGPGPRRRGGGRAVSWRRPSDRRRAVA